MLRNVPSMSVFSFRFTLFRILPTDVYTTTLAANVNLVNQMALLRAGLCQALSESVVTSLKKSKIRTVVEFLVKDVEEISQTCGIPYKVK